MPKALYGPVATADPRLLAEVVRLRARVRELEAELAALRAMAAVVDRLDLDANALDANPGPAATRTQPLTVDSLDVAALATLGLDRPVALT